MGRFRTRLVYFEVRGVVEEMGHADDPIVGEFVVADEDVVADLDDEVLSVFGVFQRLKFDLRVVRFVPDLETSDRRRRVEAGL